MNLAAGTVSHLGCSFSGWGLPQFPASHLISERELNVAQMSYDFFPPPTLSAE